MTTKILKLLTVFFYVHLLVLLSTNICQKLFVNPSLYRFSSSLSLSFWLYLLISLAFPPNYLSLGRSPLSQSTYTSITFKPQKYGTIDNLKWQYDFGEKYIILRQHWNIDQSFTGRWVGKLLPKNGGVGLAHNSGWKFAKSSTSPKVPWTRLKMWFYTSKLPSCLVVLSYSPSLTTTVA